MQSAVKRYYNVNKILMSKLGGWPTQSKFMKILLPTIITSVMFSFSFLEFIKLSETWRTVTEDCECFIMVLLTIALSIKLFILVLNNKNIERLLSLIDYHWRVFTHSLEIQIMHEYAIIGRKMTISYAVIVYTLMSLYMLIPITPQLLDFFKPLNKSRPYKYLYDIDYSFDREVYYYPVLLHSYLITVTDMSVVIITDTSYIVLVQHACGLFAAIGHRLENLTSEISSKKTSPVKDVTWNKSTDYVLYNRDDEIYRELVLLLRKHQLSLKYVHMLDSLFTLYSFVMLFINIIILSLLGIQIISLLDRKEEMIRYVSMCIGGFIHLFVLNYPGQRIMDHSTDIFKKAYNMLWYRMSQRSTRLLSILLYRCFVPCTLTAGKIYVLSMANYASMMQASISYFTALLSFK